MAGLTDKQVSGWKGKADRYEKWDGRGLGVRVTPRGIKTFVLVYHFEGKPRRLTLGRYKPAGAKKTGKDGVVFLTLSQARRAAEEAREKISEGIDPGVEKAAQRAAAQAAETIGELIDSYLKTYVRKPKETLRSADEYERMLEKDARPAWGKRKAASITRRDVIALLDDLVERGAPIGANRLLAVLSGMFTFALDREIVSINPCTRVKPPGTEKRRERMLTMLEIPKFWRGLDRADCNEAVCIAARLMLVTIQRRQEVAGIRLEELDERNGIWKIPGERTKNEQPHLVPLSPLAMDLIQAAKTRAAKIYDRPLKKSDFLFPSDRKAKDFRGPITPGAVTQALARNDKKLGKRISPHDLRRTGHSHMGGEKIGTPRFIRDRLLNHTDRTPGAHYDMTDYLPEKRTALDAWATLLQELIPETATDKNVVALRVQQ